MSEVTELLNETVRGWMRVRNEEVEQRILSGANSFEVVDKLGDRVISRTRYEVPRWREAPIKRARIAWARRRYRGSR
jgi:hypothetical protein